MPQRNLRAAHRQFEKGFENKDGKLVPAVVHIFVVAAQGKVRFAALIRIARKIGGIRLDGYEKFLQKAFRFVSRNASVLNIARIVRV